MKKIFLLVIVTAGAFQLKAQQLSKKPSDPFLLKTPPDQTFQQFKLDDSTLFKNFSVLPPSQLLAEIPNKLPGNNLVGLPAAVNIDNMPILKVSGNIDHMPIAKANGHIDRMPILKVTPLNHLSLINP